MLNFKKPDVPPHLRRDNTVIRDQKQDLFFVEAYKKLDQMISIRVALRNQMKIAKQQKEFSLVA